MRGRQGPAPGQPGPCLRPGHKDGHGHGCCGVRAGAAHGRCPGGGPIGGNGPGCALVLYPAGYLSEIPREAEEAPMATVELTAENFESVIGGADLALVDFW